MELHDGISKVRKFSPTGDETADLQALRELLDQLGELQRDPNVRRELIAIFETHPNADLGSPGPIVHSLEKAPIDEHINLLAESLKRRATTMTIWMAERCFRSELSEINRTKLLDALHAAREQGASGQVANSIEEAIAEYGG